MGRFYNRVDGYSRRVPREDDDEEDEVKEEKEDCDCNNNIKWL